MRTGEQLKKNIIADHRIKKVTEVWIHDNGELLLFYKKST